MYTASNNSVTLYMTIQSVQSNNQGLQENTQYYDQTIVLTSLVTYVYKSYIEGSCMKMYWIQIKQFIKYRYCLETYWKLLKKHCFDC